MPTAAPAPLKFPSILACAAVGLLLVMIVADHATHDRLTVDGSTLAFVSGASGFTVVLLGTLFLVLPSARTFPPSYRSLGSALITLGMLEGGRAFGLEPGAAVWLVGLVAAVAGALVSASWLNLGAGWRTVERLFPWLPIGFVGLLGIAMPIGLSPPLGDGFLGAAGAALVSVGALLFLFAAFLAAVAVSQIERADSLFVAACCLALSLTFVTVPLAPDWHPLWWWGETYRFVIYLIAVAFVLYKDRRLQEVLEARSTALEREIESRRTAEQRGREGHERLSAVFAALDAAEYGILVEDANGRLIQANRSALRHLGIGEANALIGRTWTGLGVDPGGLGAAALLAAVRAERDASSGKAGERRIFEARAAPLAGRQGTVFVFTDVTDEVRERAERERLERDLQRMQKMEALGALAGGLAHEINNLLQPILTYSDLARMRVEDPRVRNHLDRIGECVGRARDIVRGALAFARQDAPRVERRDVVRACGEGARLAREVVPRSIRFEVDLPSEPRFAMIAETELTQVLLNLVKNAADATGDGGSVVLSAHAATIDKAEAAHLAVEPGPFFVISVRDDGPGIPEAVRERLFEPFFTTKPPGQGTGLGLSVAYGIVHGFGGTIVADNPPSGGAELRVYVPLLPEG